MTIAPGGPNDPNAPKVVVHTNPVVKQTTVREHTPVVVEDHSTKKAWIAGLSVLAAALLVGVLWATNHKAEDRPTDVTVNNTEVTTVPSPTTVVETDRVVTAEPDDVKVFVSNTEASVARLSRPDDAANQAEIAAIRARMEELQRADATQAVAIRRELEDSLARMEAKSSAPASQTTTTTVITPDQSTTVQTSSSPGTSSAAPVSQAALDGLNKRVEEATAQLGQLEHTASPEAAEQLQTLNADMTTLRDKLAAVSQAPASEQASAVAEIDSELASLESAVKAIPVQ